MVRCEATTIKGTQCKNEAHFRRGELNVCGQHQFSKNKSRREVKRVELTPEEEALFDKKFQELIDAFGLAKEFLIQHKDDFRRMVVEVKELMQRKE